jgi:hypothetical protein
VERLAVFLRTDHPSHVAQQWPHQPSTLALAMHTFAGRPREIVLISRQCSTTTAFPGQ